ncbi:unnamed protein product [Ostreobium quekettii]|uniref:protein-serine/threonine phosphatase n=1 Tax=Ostreobium quekettii TaxID=121088 RepID=A0A8S1JCE4_9CHLO|nr:unnamed protein product [Ostreobium quekettii]
MEDAHLAALDIQGHPSMCMFGVFDGHGGKEVAKFVALHLVEELLKNESFQKGDFESALRSTYLRMDEVMMEEGSQAELVALAGGRQESEDIEFTDFENMELPDILRKAIQASTKDHGQQRQPFQFVKASQVTSFPISDLEDVEDEDSEEDDELPDSQEAPQGDCVKAEDAVDGLHESAPASKDSEGIPAGVPHTLSINRRNDIAVDGRPAHGQADNGGGSMLSEKPPTNGDCSGASADDASDGEVVEIDSPQTPLNMALPQDMVGALELEGLEAAEAEGCSGPLAGCTAVMALVDNKRLIVANAGDSRCVASRKGVAIPMSQDHKPTDPIEDERIRKAGGFVADGRVNGSLNLSRALGDMEYKKAKHLPPEEQMVSAFPDVRVLDLKRGDDFCVLACDGIWDVLTEQQAVDFVQERLKRSVPVDEIVQQMCDHCLAEDSAGTGEGCDNMTAMVVLLKKFCTIKGAQISGKRVQPAEATAKA